MGQLDSVKKIWALAKAMDMDARALHRMRKALGRGPRTLAEKQIELILGKAEEEGRL
jgi:hypothetical protein